jgi:hypothetical protein
VNGEGGWKQTPVGMKSSKSGRSVDSFEFTGDSRGQRTKVEVGVDRQISLSRDAVEALVGASYPNTRTDEHEAILRAAAAPARTGTRVAGNAAGERAAETFGLPTEHTVSFDFDGVTVTTHDSILRVDEALPPADVMNIDPRAKRIESRSVRAARELQEIEQLPTQQPFNSPR